MQKNMFGQTKVWMVWQTVDFNQDWLMGVFAGKRTANAAKAKMFADWLSDRDMTLDQWKAKQDQPWFDMDDPFFVTDAVVQRVVQ